MGRSNVGKSTLLNAALELPLAIVSRRPQTTRDRLLGVVRHGDAEIGLLDTPGLHRAQTKLGREMNRVARGAVHEADVIAFVVAVSANPPHRRRQEGVPALVPHPGDLELIAKLPAEARVVLVINKIDLLAQKDLLLPLIKAYAAKRELAAVVPISATRDDGVGRVLDEVARLLPEGGARHEADTLTTRPLRYFVAEYVREPILRVAGQEVPHAVAVTIDELIEPEEPARAVRVAATIHVEREGQKRILIGKGGSMLKDIGIRARVRIEQLVGRKVHLELFVRVTSGWRDRPELLADFGLRAKGAP